MSKQAHLAELLPELLLGVDDLDALLHTCALPQPPLQRIFGGLSLPGCCGGRSRAAAPLQPQLPSLLLSASAGCRTQTEVDIKCEATGLIGAAGDVDKLASGKYSTVAVAVISTSNSKLRCRIRSTISGHCLWRSCSSPPCHVGGRLEY